MTTHTAAKQVSEVLAVERPTQAESYGDVRASELAHIKSEFYDRLAPSDSKGLLATAVRLILEENGFRPDTRSQHCGCSDCAKRCHVCADYQPVA